MFPFEISVVNETEKRLNSKRIDDIKKILDQNVKRLNEFNIVWESNDIKLNIYPNQFTVLFKDNKDLPIDLTKRLINLLEYRNILYMECIYRRLLVSDDVDEIVRLITKMGSVNNFSDIVVNPVILKTEFLMTIENIPYLIGFYLEQKSLKSKIVNILYNIQNSNIDLIFTNMEKILNKAVNDLLIKETESNE